MPSDLSNYFLPFLGSYAIMDRTFDVFMRQDAAPVVAPIPLLRFAAPSGSSLATRSVALSPASTLQSSGLRSTTSIHPAASPGLTLRDSSRVKGFGLRVLI